MGWFGDRRAKKREAELFEQYKDLFEKPKLPDACNMETYADFERQCEDVLRGIGLEIEVYTPNEKPGQTEYLCNVAKVAVSVTEYPVSLSVLKDFYEDSRFFGKPIDLYLSGTGFEPDAIQFAYRTGLVLVQMAEDGKVGGVTQSGMLLLLMGTRAILWGQNYGDERLRAIFEYMYPNVTHR